MSVAAMAVLAGVTFVARGATVSVVPEADAFVRSLAPASNYGGAGALAVSGPLAVNAAGQQNGSFDSLLRFPMSDAVAALNATLGTPDWLVRRLTLSLTEMAAPPSPMFNRGVGAFEIFWVASDSWIEGTGTPAAPTNDGVTWNGVPSIVKAATAASLGRFTNSGVDGPLSFVLSLAEPLLSSIRSGAPATLYLTAVSPQIGFTADSRHFPVPGDVPALEIVASVNPHPRIDSIEVLATNAVVSFNTVSNWAYAVQGADEPAGSWSNLLTLGPQSTNGHVAFAEGMTNRQRFYRLMVSE